METDPPTEDASSNAIAPQDGLHDFVYAELYRMAAACMAAENPGHTLQPTALVHEAWLRLQKQSNAVWKNEGHFMAIAASAMRRILVDHARRKKSHKRGGSRLRVELEPEVAATAPSVDGCPDIEAIDRGLSQLRQRSARMANLVELRFFAGLAMDQVARYLEASTSTIEREWRVARAWLQAFVDRERQNTERG